MSNSFYNAEPRVYDLMRELVANYHPDLALVVDEIAIVFKDKASKSNGRAVLGKPKKASPLFGVLGDTDYKFVLELAADEWLNLDSRKQKALLDHLLCGCRAEESDDGALKCGIAQPDVSFYWDEFDRWGDWRPRPEGEGSEVSIEEAFGKKNADEDSDEDEDLFAGLGDA